MRPTNLNMDVLRTLAKAVELGGFARAGEQLGRTQSAVSLQMKKLEEQVGRPLFRKEGRTLQLTDAGDIILGYAQRMLQLNDEAIAMSRAVGLAGSVRLGVPPDLAETWLPSALAQFSRLHPNIHIEAHVDRNVRLIEQTLKSQLDLSLAFGDGGDAPRQQVAELPVRWIGRRSERLDLRQGVPLVLFDQPCFFREIGIEALEKHQIPWRLAFTSPSLAGLWAAAEAGIGISVRTPLGLPKTLSVLGADTGLPVLTDTVRLSLYAAPGQAPPAITRLRAIMLETLSNAVRAIRAG
ncbi:MAG TPA: LysR substrate-binding domain-containing protein [Kaistia sp.]|nr:LysR substrate-binding domain-containing protein [Kaistia sp.]